VSEVKRYVPTDDMTVPRTDKSSPLVFGPPGEYVTYADYATLRAERDALAERNAGLQASCEHLKSAYDSYVVACDALEAKLARVLAVQRWDLDAGSGSGGGVWLNSEPDPNGDYMLASEVLAATQSDSGGGGE
jgi:hypothetical protein